MNSEEELNSFPLTQSIFLRSSEVLEESFLSSNIFLIRENKEFGLFNLGSVYSQTVGYIKESFNPIPLEFELTSTGGINVIKVKPTEILKPSQFYSLLISDNLSREFLEVTKPVTKSQSTISVNYIKDTLRNTSVTVTVLSKPSFKGGTNKIKVQVDDDVFSLDIKENNKIVYRGLELIFEDTAYVMDEQFVITIGTPETLNIIKCIHIRSNIYDNISEVESTNASTKVTNLEILEYYNKEITTPVTCTLTYEYVDTDTILVTLSGCIVPELDLLSCTIRESPAFNNYTLKQYGYYEPDKEYTYTTEVIDDSSFLLKIIETV